MQTSDMYSLVVFLAILVINARAETCVDSGSVSDTVALTQACDCTSSGSDDCAVSAIIIRCIMDQL